MQAFKATFHEMARPDHAKIEIVQYFQYETDAYQTLRTTYSKIATEFSPFMHFENGKRKWFAYDSAKRRVATVTTEEIIIRDRDDHLSILTGVALGLPSPQ